MEKALGTPRIGWRFLEGPTSRNRGGKSKNSKWNETKTQLTILRRARNVHPCAKPPTSYDMICFFLLSRG